MEFAVVVVSWTPSKSLLAKNVFCSIELTEKNSTDLREKTDFK